MKAEQLAAIFSPKSVAVIGASANPSKFGYQILQLLQNEGFEGRIYPVNARYEHIMGLRCYGSLADLPEAPDVAVVVVPAEQVLASVRECVRRGVKGVVVIASGFAEAGDAGKALQNELRQIVAGSNTRVVGPNCEGLINVSSRMVLSFSPMFAGLRPGPVSIVSHSGAYCGVVAQRMCRSGVGLAKIISAGNEVDLTATDYLEYLADDQETKVVLAYLEEIRKPMEFKRLIGRLTRKKPVVIHKAGRTEAGKKAVASHTGALAGSDQVVSALFRQSGVVRAKSITSLIDAGLGLATQPLARGNRVAILSGAGGLAVDTAELCIEAGLSIPVLSSRTQQKLAAILPYFAAVSNPVDMTTVVLSDPPAVGEALATVLEDPGIDAVLFVLTLARDRKFAEVVYETIQRYDKPVLVGWTAGVEVAPDPINYLMEKGVPIFDSPERLRTAIQAVIQYSRYRLGEEFIMDGQAGAA